MNIAEKVFHRYEKKPLIAPKDVPGAYGTFNCGQTMYNGKTILLLPVQEMGNQVPSIHLAESEDGINFNIHSEPFIKRSEKFYDLDHWPIDPRVAYIPEDDMYYIIRPIISSWGCSSLLLRTKDFKSVEEMGVVALPNNRVPSLFQGKVNGRYARLDRPYGGAGSSGGGNIWISYSDDLIHWGDYKPFMKPYTNWAADKIGPTPPIKTKYGWLEIYHGVKSLRYSLGAVLMDLDDPTKIIARTKSPILTPNEPYEYMGHTNAGTVFACGAIVEEEKDEIRLYYGAADCAIGLATAKLSELIDTMMYEEENCEEWIWS